MYASSKLQHIYVTYVGLCGDGKVHISGAQFKLHPWSVVPNNSRVTSRIGRFSFSLIVSNSCFIAAQLLSLIHSRFFLATVTPGL